MISQPVAFLGPGSDLPLGGVCDPLYPPGTYLFYRTLASTAICILGAATAAGLTMGLISLDELELMILIECAEDDCETQEEKEELRRNQAYAKQVLPLVTRHHQLLVTLLLWNSIANESLPLFLDSLVPSWIAIILSVSFILFFGEIIPSAIFTGSSGLKISAALSPVVYVAMVLAYPIVAPIAWILDRWLVHKSDAAGRYNKAQLLALLRLHMMKEADGLQPSPMLLYGGSSADLESSGSRPNRYSNRGSVSSNALPAPSQNKRGLLQNEVKMMRGAMNLRGTRARDVMTPADEVYMLDIHRKLDLATLAEIVEKGHSRIPVYADDNLSDIRGVLSTKKLTALSPDDAYEVGSIGLRPPVFVHADDPLSTVLRMLKVSRSHLAIVTDNPRQMFRRFDERGVWRGKWPSAPKSKVDFESEAPRMAALDSEEPRMLGVVSLLDIIQKLVDETLAEEDQFVPPLPQEWLSASSRWSFAEDQQTVIAEPKPDFGHLSAWASAVRSKFSGRRYASTSARDDIQQQLVDPLLPSSDALGIFPGRKVSFSENVEIVNFQKGDEVSDGAEASLV